MELRLMIKMSVLYPNTPEGKFDLEYYTKQHIPLVTQWCEGAIKKGEVERGIAGATPGSEAPYCVAAHLFFDSTESMEQSFYRHLPKIIADMPNFTNLQPVVQISEVML
jgi:uncharacterized protein (TIGR02118 family)